MTPSCTADAIAVDHILNLMHRDPRVAYFIGPGSRSWELLTAAVAERTGKSVQDVRNYWAEGLTFERPARSTP